MTTINKYVLVGKKIGTFVEEFIESSTTMETFEDAFDYGVETYYDLRLVKGKEILNWEKKSGSDPSWHDGRR